MKIPSYEYCDNLLNKYCVPRPIRLHCEAVTEVGVFLAENLNRVGVDVDVALVEAICRVHDAFKAASFNELAPMPELNYFPTQEEITIWKEIHNRFPDMHETLIATEMLRDEYPEFANEVVSQIGSTGNSCYLQGGIELKIAHYADWRVQQDQIISFDDRLDYLCKTYKDAWAKTGVSWDDRYEQEKLLEKEIFDKLNFSPDDLERIVVNQKAHTLL